MKSKAIIFDIDGTIVDSPGQKLPSKRLIKAIENLKEQYHFCTATGRVWTFAKDILTALNIDGPCIISGGTQLCDPRTGKILSQKNIDDKALKEVIEIVKKYPEYKVLYNETTEEEYMYGGYDPRTFIIDEPVYFFEQTFIPVDVAEEIYQKLNRISEIVCIMVIAQKTNSRDLHVINKEATKEHAINELLKILNVSKENTIGIGDGYNDLHLFNAVGYKIAVGNAAPELKEKADLVIGSVSKDGVAEYLEEI
jgi:Cof subfamily protein (haloacid dehalogenase superfamily)